MPKKVESWACGVCGLDYSTEAEAATCEAKGMPPRAAEVGDIVLLHAGFGWFDGLRSWVENFARLGAPEGKPVTLPAHGNCFGACCSFQFYYVVTAITLDPRREHEWRYHVETLAMTGGYSRGWTGAGHYLPRPVQDPPPEVVAGSRALIGHEFDNLL